MCNLSKAAVRRIGFVVLLTCLATSAAAPAATLADFDAPAGFDHITAPPGLTQNNVTAIAQDRHGFLWFGTQDGLHRFDGYEFKIYRHDPRNEATLSSSFIRALLVDPEGRLWVGSEPGLSRYDEAKDQFQRVTGTEAPNAVQSEANVLSLALDQSNTIWIGTTNGLYYIDESQSPLQAFEPPAGSRTLSGLSINTLTTADSGLWIGSSQGLAHLSKAAGLSWPEFLPDADPQSRDVRAMAFDGQQHLWVGTFGGGIVLVGPDGSTVSRLVHDPDNSQSLSHNRIARILRDQAGAMWIGTFGGGITVYDPVTGGFEWMRNEAADRRSLSHDQVRSLFEDNSGVVWVGTGAGGINKYDRRGEQFAHFRHRTQDPGSLSHNGISALHIDPSGTLWVGTFGGGLNRFDPPGSFSQFRHDPEEPNSISSDRVFAIEMDREGILWVGTGENGLNRFDPGTGQFEIFTHDPDQPSSLAHNRVRAILEDSQGQLWVGTYGGGLDVLDRESGRFAHHRHNPEDPDSISGDAIRVILEDTRGDIWVGTGAAGLNRFRRDTGSFEQFKHDPTNPGSLSHNRIQSVHEDRLGFIWVGTAAGLNRLDPASGLVRIYTESDGLPNDVIYSVVSDQSGMLWLSTNRGISRFDPEQVAFENFDDSQGLQANEFNSAAGVSGPDGTLVFGGINGITMFKPQTLERNTFDPPVRLTSFLLFNEPLDPEPDNPEALLPTPTHLTSELTLDYSHSVFSIEFVALDYSAPERNVYRYRLKGFDDTWIKTDALRRVATFTRLPPGEYEFEVQGTNSYGQWSSSTAALSLLVEPPPWRTAWAYSLYALTLLGGIVLYFYSQRRRTVALEKTVAARTSELAHKNEELELQRKAAVAAAEAKAAFLATMSHEIRTPMTAIMGMLQLLGKSNLSKAQIQDVETIHDSSEALLTIVDQILQFSRMEQGQLQSESVPFNPRRLIKGVATLMQSIATNKGLSIHAAVDPALPSLVRGDPEKIRQILINLLSNAIRFTDSGHVNVTAGFSQDDSSAAGGRLRIEVADTGVGIPEEAKLKVFEPFSQADPSITRRFGGTGMGLAICQALTELLEGEIGFKSEVDRGSTFWVELPLDAAASLDDQDQQPSWTVMLIEDLAINRNIATGLLQSEGHLVLEYDSGIEALAKLQSHEFDLVLVDLHMPGMDGYEVAERIHAIRPTLPVFALTAAGNEVDHQRLRAAGIATVLRKPLDYRRLKTAFREHAAAEVNVDDTWLDQQMLQENRARLGLEKSGDLYESALDQLETLTDQALQACEHNNGSQVRELAHQIAGAGSAYGFHAIARLGTQLETASIDKKFEAATAYLVELKTALRMTKQRYQACLTGDAKAANTA